MGEDPANDVKAEDGPIGLLRLAAAVSIFWIIGVICLLVSSKPPDELNKWGDYAAGASAPLAFLWLIVAVVLQSRELREQRKELKLTREELKLTRQEFKLQRQVMKAQQEEARRQADFVQMQTSILTETHNKDRMDAEFTAAAAYAASFIRRYKDSLVFRSGEPHQRDDTPISIDFTDDLTDELLIASAAQKLRNEVRTSWYKGYSGRLLTRYPHDFRRLYEAIQESVAQLETSEGLQTMRVRALEIEQLGHTLRSMKPRVANYPRDNETEDPVG